MSFTFDDRYNHYNCDVCNARHYGSKPQSCYKCKENKAKEQQFQQRIFEYLKENLSIKVDRDYGSSTRWVELYLINPKTKQDVWMKK